VNKPIREGRKLREKCKRWWENFEEISGLECLDNKNIERVNYPSGEETFLLTRCLVRKSDKIPAIMTLLFWFPAVPLPQMWWRTIPSKPFPIKQVLNINNAKMFEWSNHAFGRGYWRGIVKNANESQATVTAGTFFDYVSDQKFSNIRPLKSLIHLPSCILKSI
jgi:hypothetical protein